jgi:hypothetical protein
MGLIVARLVLVEQRAQLINMLILLLPMLPIRLSYVLTNNLHSAVPVPATGQAILSRS